jgi:hypothetical protein
MTVSIIEKRRIPLSARQKSLEHALEEAVSRALRDNLAPLQRTADELQHAYADLIAACGSSRPSNALPALLRAQTAASSLAAGLSVLTNFVAVSLNPRESQFSDDSESAGASAAVAVEEEEEAAVTAVAPAHVQAEPELEWSDEPEEVLTEAPEAAELQAAPVAHVEASSEEEVEEASAAATQVFDVATLPKEAQDLHRRANRVAKVAMQDIKLLQPKEVKLGREHKDICHRLRSDIDKARKEYDRRFRSIQDHPVDYFHHWMVEILAGGDVEALGEYPYPSPVLRH